MGYGIFRDEDGNYNKRLIGLVLLVLVVIVGTGVGTIGITNDSDPEPGQPDIEVTPLPAEPTPISTPTPDGAEPNPTGTPNESGGSGSPPPSDLLNETPTPTPTPVLTPTPSSSPPDDSTASDTTGESSDNGSGGSGGGSSDSGRDSSDSEDDSGPSGSLSLETRGSAVLLQVGELAPGDTESGSVVVRNSGSDAGTLGVADVNVSDDENGLQEPERALGDTAATGELSDHLDVRLRITYADGTTEYLAGSDTSNVTLASLDRGSEQGTRAVAGGDQATVEIEVTLPESTGNEVQSDRVELTVPIVLQELRS